MKIKVIGKAHLEGTSRKSGKPYNFNQVHFNGNKYLHGQSIEHRPECIKGRESVGHWEMDTVKGLTKDSKNLLVMTERYSRLQVIKLLPDKTALTVVRAVDRVFRQYGKHIQTITCDNGPEFAYIERIEHDAKGKKRCDLYFCHPYCAAERGSNEHANAIIRRWFPKGKTFSRIKTVRLR